MHGKGVLTSPSGRKCEGDFVKGEFHRGKIIFMYPDGVRYEGDFVADRGEGKGLLILPDGS